VKWIADLAVPDVTLQSQSQLKIRVRVERMATVEVKESNEEL
jgi:hypothetical protein